MSIRHELTTLLKDIAPEIEDVTLEGDRALKDQIEIDSIDFLNFIIAIHKKFGVNIPEKDYPQIQTMNDLSSYLEAQLTTRR